jgi:hypothetical protein
VKRMLRRSALNVLTAGSTASVLQDRKPHAASIAGEVKLQVRTNRADIRHGAIVETVPGQRVG